jgi:uncharacterized protein (TIGR02391 family)
MTGLGSDGVPLVEEAFGLRGSRTPPRAFNSLRTDTERSEQRGLVNLLNGLPGTFRNPTAHAPRQRGAGHVVTTGRAAPLSRLFLERLGRAMFRPLRATRSHAAFDPGGA